MRLNGGRSRLWHLAERQTTIHGRSQNEKISDWTEDNRWAYFIIVDGKLAGFAMVTTRYEVDDRDTHFSMAEFCVLLKYRRSGVGKQVFYQLLKMHTRKWQLKLHPANTASVHFWKNTIEEYTRGKYELVKAYPHTEYDDGTLADVFLFES